MFCDASFPTLEKASFLCARLKLDSPQAVTRKLMVNFDHEQPVSASS